ncbi:hypothetical protein MKX01_013874, partial [Papaver californicum]
KRGAIVKASEEQIRALSPHTCWPFVSESNGPYNLLHHHPMHSYNYGQLYQVTGNEYKQLENRDVALTFANITNGGMAGPYYSSRATKIAIVVEGNGYFEMACPHLSSSSGSTGRSCGRYQKVRAKLSRGDVIVAPLDTQLRLLLRVIKIYRYYALRSMQGTMRRFYLQDGTMSSTRLREAKEMAFNISYITAREVEEIFNNQEETFFFTATNERQEQGRAVT